MTVNGRPEIAVVQLARFGDFLQTTPLLAALKQARPEARLTAVVNSPQENIARANPHVDRVTALNISRLEAEANRPSSRLSDKIVDIHSGLLPLSDVECDLAINLNTSGLAALVSELIPASERRGARFGPDRRRMIAAPWAGFIMGLMTNRRLIRFNLVDLLASYADATERSCDRPVYPLQEEDLRRGKELAADQPGPRIGLQMGSRHQSRQWPVDRFALLAARLIRERGATVHLLGMKSEAHLGREMLAELNRLDPAAAVRVVNLMGRTSIGDLAGVLHNMDLLITTDTGTMHLAAAVGTKILALFIGPALCHETGPYGAGHVILQTTTPCSPCTEGEAGCSDHWCRRLIGVEAAARLAGWIIDGRPGRPDVDPGPQVQALVSEFDSWGVTCQPLAAPKMTRTELMALAYREAGRRYIRPGYRPDAEVAAREAAERGLADDFCLSELAGRLADIGADPGRVPSLIDDEDLAPLARLLKSAAADRPEAAGRLAADIRRVVDGAAAPHAPENVPDRADSGTELATYIGLRVRS